MRPATLYVRTSRDRDPFDAALSLLALPPAARRIIPRQQGAVVIRVKDIESRRRTEARIGF
jgi:hypothetical protein